MRVLVVGATGVIGRAVVAALKPEHEVITASRKHSEEQVDISKPDSIRQLFTRVGKVDAIVSAAGSAAFKPLADLSDEDFHFSLTNKLMGQVNLVRYGLPSVREGGSITLTSGTLSQNPVPGSGAVSLVNAAIEGFTRAAALEAGKKARINVVSPGWVSETLKAMGRDPKTGIPAAQVARVYVQSVTGRQSGMVLPAVGTTVGRR
jgi:NAD(P)-dependent dehydrogenase (short-subunit alcohol dehydrogenase family)